MKEKITSKMIKYIKKNKIKILTISILLVIFLILAFYVNIKSDKNIQISIDTKVYNFIKKYINESNTQIIKMITLLGKEFIIFLSIVIAIFGLIKSYIYRNIKTLINTFFATLSTPILLLLNFTLKLIIERDRPNILPLTIETSYSFPSSHSFSSTIFYLTLAYIIIKILNEKIKNKDKNKSNKVILLKILKIFIIIISILLPIIISLTRVYLGIHYFTDICAGLLFGLIMFIININIYEIVISKIEMKCKK